MQNQQRIKEKLLEEVSTLKEKLEEIENLAEKNGVSVKDLAKRAKKDSRNFYNKMEAVEEMASKK